MNKYRFIDAEKAHHRISDLCAVLSVPEASYYDWNRAGRANTAARDEREAVLVERLREFHDASGETYGSPRVHEDCVTAGIVVSKRRVAELMRTHEIKGLSGREHTTTTTRRDTTAAPFPDLLQREFTAAAPDVAWYGDITYIWLGDRFWYLATVIDACSKRVVGWALENHMETSLVTTALRNAIARRGGIDPGVIFHTDRGSQYNSGHFRRLCKTWGIRQSMGRTGVCWDNAAAESFFATIKRELIDRYHWNSIGQLRNGLFTWIESWYNTRRRHTTIGNIPPAQAEQQHHETKAS